MTAPRWLNAAESGCSRSVHAESRREPYASGFVPGIAVTHPLTAVTCTDVDADGRTLPDHFVDIPWVLIGTLVVVLPLLAASIVGLTARSRLPLMARID